MIAIRRWLVPALAFMAAGAAGSTPAVAGKCSDTYHVSGVVLNSFERPVPGARVYLLLDRVSEREYAMQGVRAVSTSTDESGRYSKTIVCHSSQPDPCARSPRHLTVVASSKGSRMKLKTLALKALDLETLADRCRVRVPPITLSNGL